MEYWNIGIFTIPSFQYSNQIQATGSDHGNLLSWNWGTLPGSVARQLGDPGGRRVREDPSRLRPSLRATDGAAEYRTEQHHPLFPDPRPL
jgi:hypothetical protein